MAKPSPKKFSWLIAGWKQLGVIVVMLVGGWWSKTYSPEAWKAMEPHIVSLWATLGSIVGLWDAATLAVANKVSEKE